MKSISLNQLSSLDFFTKETLRQLEPNGDTLDFNIKSWLKAKKIIALKKGLYLLRERWEKEPNKQGFLDFLANKIYPPSYLSGETVMARYGLLTEAVYGQTSVTTAKTKVFKNSLGVFSYYSIAPRLYSGYTVSRFYSAPVLTAAKAKAVFDFLYFRFLRLAPINSQAAAALRLNWENINNQEFAAIKKYAQISRSRKIRELINLIIKRYA